MEVTRVVAWPEIGANTISGISYLSGRHMIKVPAAFVIGEDESRRLPSRAIHQRVDYFLRVLCSGLRVTVRMFIQNQIVAATLDEDHLGQLGIGCRIGQK